MTPSEIKVLEVEKSTKAIKSFEEKEWTLADIEHYGKPVDLKKRHLKFLAKNKENKIVGTLDVMVEADLAFLEGLLVSSQHRRMGIGKHLLEEAERKVKQEGCKKIWLETNKGWGSEKFYLSMGYKITGEHKNHILGQDTLIFTKFL